MRYGILFNNNKGRGRSRVHGDFVLVGEVGNPTAGWCRGVEPRRGTDRARGRRPTGFLTRNPNAYGQEHQESLALLLVSRRDLHGPAHVDRGRPSDLPGLVCALNSYGDNHNHGPGGTPLGTHRRGSGSVFASKQAWRTSRCSLRGRQGRVRASWASAHPALAGEGSAGCPEIAVVRVGREGQRHLAARRRVAHHAHGPLVVGVVDAFLGTDRVGAGVVCPRPAVFRLVLSAAHGGLREFPCHHPRPGPPGPGSRVRTPFAPCSRASAWGRTFGLACDVPRRCSPALAAYRLRFAQRGRWVAPGYAPGLTVTHSSVEETLGASGKLGPSARASCSAPSARGAWWPGGRAWSAWARMEPSWTVVVDGGSPAPTRSCSSPARG
ncbi:MAG: hypothetical protein WC654_00020 [Patescibacteria group bacterium]